MNLRTGQWHSQLYGHKRSAEFVDFLSGLPRVYPSGHIYVVLDNVELISKFGRCTTG